MAGTDGTFEPQVDQFLNVANHDENPLNFNYGLGDNLYSPFAARLFLETYDGVNPLGANLYGTQTFDEYLSLFNANNGNPVHVFNSPHMNAIEDPVPDQTNNREITEAHYQESRIACWPTSPLALHLLPNFLLIQRWARMER
ncbi:hypothetical protein L6164_007359 [Bauhinia variegata]|uniref:Uncharacterized protein n=1 Tax=Bauhinia variegata TaxID=167791 RepID=A0ACB9PCL4_BAUVA|nr:hypothetical protein L6164_007359 [Bauhinia variegata]